MAMILGIVIPGIVLNGTVWITGSDMKEFESPATKTEMEHEEETAEVRVLMDDGGVVVMELEQYITGVVLAEMPVSFEEEALKAQSVVARTYTLRAMSGKGKHREADVCTRSACCQAYRNAESKSDEDMEKVKSAVFATKGEVLLYEGELIEATYFSCSGGSTEDAVSVWGTEVPYLVATDSPGEEYATHYSDTVAFSAEEFLECLSLTSSLPAKDWLGPVTYTAGGGVAQMEICGKTFAGTELRKLLNLKSTSFVMTLDDDVIHIRTRGYGHRVGMSQYGADAMALQGHGYRQILAHYYKGTTIEMRND